MAMVDLESADFTVSQRAQTESGFNGLFNKQCGLMTLFASMLYD